MGVLGMLGVGALCGYLFSGPSESGPTRQEAELQARLEQMERRVAQMERRPQAEPIVVHKTVQQIHAPAAATGSHAAARASASARTHVEHLGRQIPIPATSLERKALAIALTREAYAHHFVQRPEESADAERVEQLEQVLGNASVTLHGLECRGGACRADLELSQMSGGRTVLDALRDQARELKLKRYRMIPQGPDAPLRVELYVEQEGGRPILPASL